MAATDDTPGKRARDPLTEQRIIAAAIAFADDHGLAELSMRKLAKSLGYEVMSLYNHVAGRHAIIDAMLEAVAAELPLPASGDDWKKQLRESMIESLRVMRAHPWVVPIWNTRLPGPARLTYMEAVLSTLMAAGLSDEMADHGFHALATHLQGFALQEQAFELPTDTDDLQVALADFQRSLDPERYPSMLAHVEWHRTVGETQEFEFVLDLILDGLGS